MTQREQHIFDAPIDAVWAMFHDPASHVAKFERMGHRNVTILEEERDDTALRLVVARDVTLELPGFAKKVLSPTNHVVSTDLWRDNGDGTFGGHFEADIKGAPVDLRGRTLIRPEGDGHTRYELEVEVTVHVPLLGRKLTSWAESNAREQMRQEFATGDVWLAEQA